MALQNSVESTENIQKALAEGFTLDSLRILLKNALNKDLENISNGGNLNSVIFDVVEASNREGWIEELVISAKQANPDNFSISTLELLDVQSAYDDGSEDTMTRSHEEDAKTLGVIKFLLLGSKDSPHVGFIEATTVRLDEVEQRIQEIQIVIKHGFLNSFIFKTSFIFIALASIMNVAVLILLLLEVWGR